MDGKLQLHRKVKNYFNLLTRFSDLIILIILIFYNDSTYMSNNIAVPASIVGDNEQTGTFGQPHYRPGRFNQHLGSPVSSNQSYHTAYLSPHNIPSNYGSVARSF